MAPDANGRGLAVIASALLALIGLALSLVPGPRPSVDFWGGTFLQVQFDRRLDEGRLVRDLDALGFDSVNTIWLPSVDKVAVAVVGEEAPDRVRTQVQAVLDRGFPGAMVNQVRPVSAPAARRVFEGAILAVAFVFAAGLLWTWFRFGVSFVRALAVGQGMNLAQALGISAAARPPFGVTAVWMLILVLIVSFLGATVVFRAIATQLRAPPPMALGDAIDRALARGRMWVWGISGVSLAIAPTPLALWLASAASLGLCAVSTLYVIPFLLPKLAHKSPALSGAKAPG